MEITILSTEQALYLLSAVTTIVTAMITLVIYSLRRTRDPFLQYYVVTAFAVGVTYWLLMKWNFGQAQLEAVFGTFVLLGGLAFLSVIWRFVSVYFYVRTSKQLRRPYGFSHGHSNFGPYFLLASAWILMTLWITLYYTVKEPNIPNRMVILSYFAVLFLFLGLCRVAWEVVEKFGSSKLSEKKPDTMMKSLQGMLRAADLDHGLVDIDIGGSRVQITDVPEKYYEILGGMLGHEVIVQATIDDGGPYQFREIKQTL